MEVPNNTVIAIIGLGYVGMPLAVEFGKIYPTIGFDINAQRIAELRQGVPEPHAHRAPLLVRPARR